MSRECPPLTYYVPGMPPGMPLWELKLAALLAE